MLIFKLTWLLVQTWRCLHLIPPVYLVYARFHAETYEKLMRIHVATFQAELRRRVEADPERLRVVRVLNAFQSEENNELPGYVQ